MRTQLSNCLVNSHEPESSYEFYQWSNIRHGIFRSRVQRRILAVRIIRSGRGKDACVFLADWIATLAYIDLKWENLKIFFSETARPNSL